MKVTVMFEGVFLIGINVRRNINLLVAVAVASSSDITRLSLLMSKWLFRIEFKTESF